MHFSKSCHTELWVLTLVILNPVMTNPRFQGPPNIFLMCFGFNILILRVEKILNNFTGSLFTEHKDLGLLQDSFPWSIPSHVGCRQRHKPQLCTMTSTELGMFGIYFEWSLIISNVLLGWCAAKIIKRHPQKFLSHLAEDMTFLK